jgi:flagellar hook-length control protein FliK
VAVAAPAGASGGGTGTGTGTERGPADEAPAETAPTTSAAAGPAPSAAAPAVRTEAATGAAVAQPVAGQLARSVAVLRGGPDGAHTMTVVLTPEALGPVEVSVTLSQGTVELTLRGAHDHGRAALVDALPDLRRDLEAAGLTCSRVDVDRGARDGSWSGSQSSASAQAGGREGGGRGPQQERSENGARPWHRPADNEEGHPARTRGVSGLDVRV